MTKKKKIIIAVSSVVVGSVAIVGTLAVVCLTNPSACYWILHNSPYDWRTENIVQGTFVAKADSRHPIENTYTLRFEPIEEEAYVSANGLNVLKDISNDHVREHDFWSVTLTMTNDSTGAVTDIPLIGLKDPRPNVKKAHAVYENEEGSIRLGYVKRHLYYYCIKFPTKQYFEPGIKESLKSELFFVCEQFIPDGETGGPGCAI